MSKLKWSNITVKLGELKPWADNPRMSTKAQAHRILKSFEKFGQVITIAVDPDLEVLDGHQRLSALLTIHGRDYQIDARQSDRKLELEERKELIINLHTGATGSWDWNALSGWSAGDLQEWGMNLDTKKQWDNDSNNLKELLTAEVEAVDAEPQTDRAGELAELWHTASGQLWKLGDHKLLIGDCTVRENVERLMGGERADCVITDPPYALFGNSTGVSGIADDKMVRPFFRDIAKISMEFTKEFSHVYICCDWHSAFVIQDIMQSTGLTAKNLCIWDKGDGGIGANYQQCYEMIWFFSNSPKATGTLAHKKTGEKTVNGVPNIWRFNRATIDRVHNAEKPVKLFEVPMKNATKENEIVLDLFLGGGTTIIAAHNLNRRCFAMEISEKYGAVILQRFLDATGIQPELLL
ncbi:MAG: DNA methyltransferase [Methylococcaceae bacterium]